MTKSIWLAVVNRAFVKSFIRPLISTLAGPAAFLPLAIVHLAVHELLATRALLLAIHKVANKYIAVLRRKFAEAMGEVLVPLAFVFVPVVEQRRAKSLLEPLLLFAFVVVAGVVVKYLDVEWRDDSFVAQVAETALVLVGDK